MEEQKKISRISNKQTEKFGDIFQNSLGYIFKKHKNEYLTAYIACHWEDIMGKNIAKRVQFVGIEQKEILLYSKYPSWSHELKMLQEDVVSKVNVYAGKNLAKTVRFVKTFSPNSLKQQKVKNNKTLKRNIKFDNLTKAETERIQASLAGVKDGDLKEILEKYKSYALRLQNYKKEHFIKCKICGEFNESGICEKCAVEREKSLKTKIKTLLRDAPFLSYAEAVQEIKELTPDMFHKIRVEMVQKMAKTINGRDGVTFESIALTMLYKGMRPEYITEDMVKSTLKRLRFDLAVPPRFEKDKSVEK